MTYKPVGITIFSPVHIQFVQELFPGANPGICVRGADPLLLYLSRSSFPLPPLPSPLEVGYLKPARGSGGAL